MNYHVECLAALNRIANALEALANQAGLEHEKEQKQEREQQEQEQEAAENKAAFDRELLLAQLRNTAQRSDRHMEECARLVREYAKSFSEISDSDLPNFAEKLAKVGGIK